MKKPSNYDNTPVAGDFEPIEKGGHLCVIKQVEETKSKNGLDMLVISLDTDTNDKQPKYFEKQYKNDTRQEKKWGCVMYLVIDENTDYGTKNLKTFCSCAEKSNAGFNVSWGDNWGAQFKDKKIGAVFGREQYMASDGNVKWATKPKWFRSTDNVLEANAPEDKFLAEEPSQVSSDGFMNIPDTDLDELPFN